jgi:hypothetical protein
MPEDDALEPIPMSGTPQQLGEAFGGINSRAISLHLAAFLETCVANGLDEAAVIEMSQSGLGIIRELAPWWEAEMEALAEAAAVSPALYKAFAIGKYRGLFFGEPECTSYAATGSYVPFSAGTCFHKSRDNVSRLQCAFVRRVEDPAHDVYAWCGTSDTSDVTPMMFVNEHGLAGSGDFGSKDPNYYGEGLMNTFGLRYVAETCRDCNEALAVRRDWTEQRYYAGGANKTNYMFSDADGNILRVVQSNDSIEPQMTTEGIVMNCHRKRLESDLLRHAGHLDAFALSAASRIKSVSMPSTISSLSVDCRPEQPELLTCAWFALGQPTRAAYVPVFVASRNVPRALLDGSVYRRSMPSRARMGEIRELEAGFKLRVENCLEEARTLISSGQAGEIPELTERVTADCVREVLDKMPGDI